MRVFVHGAAATPNHLLEALVKHAAANNLRDVEMIHIHTHGSAEYNKPEYEGKANPDLHTAFWSPSGTF